MIAVCTTIATFAMAEHGTWGYWLDTAEQLRDQSPVPVAFFAAIEIDVRGIHPFRPLLDRLAQLNGDHWRFLLDDGRTSVTTANRLRHITAGQNLCSDYATAAGATHMLFLAADCRPPADAIPKLLEVDWPIVGGEVPTYCLSGPPVDRYPFPVEQHMATAAFILIARPVFKQLKWRWDADLEMSDDPCFHHDAIELLDTVTLVRKDCIGQHYPEAIGAIETRRPGRDMTVYR